LKIYCRKKQTIVQVGAILTRSIYKMTNQSSIALRFSVLSFFLLLFYDDAVDIDDLIEETRREGH